MQYLEEIVEITVSNGEFGSSIEPMTKADGSKVVGVVQYNNGLTSNPDMINAKIMANGTEVSPNQHIENYRSREASYEKGYKPIIPFDSGVRVRIEIVSTSAFTADFKAQFVLIKEKTC